MVYRPSEVRSKTSSKGPDVPELLPVMNLFLTIVPVLLFMMVITQVALLAFNFNQAAVEPTTGRAAQAPRAVKLSVFIRTSAPDAFEIRQPGRPSEFIPLVNGRYDYISLDDAIRQVKINFPEEVDFNVGPYPDVLYDDLIKTIDICRSHGFTNIHYLSRR